MIKRIFSAMLCLVLLTAAFSVNAFATSNRVDTKVADAKIYVENDKVEKGDIVNVTIYAENITAKNGVLAVDFPLSYDKSKLSFVKLDCIYPSAWGFYGEFFGHPTPDEDPWYLRSIPDAGDVATNPVYRIKADKQIGYKLTFKAVAEGEAYVAVEDVGNKKIMFVSIEDDEVINYGGNGMKVKIQIGDTEDNSSAAPEVSDDPSEPESNDPVDESSVDDNSQDVDNSVEDQSSENDLSSEEDQSTEESSEDTSIENTSTETSSVASSDASAESEGSKDAENSSEGSEASSEESASGDKNDADNDDGGLPGFVVPVVIVVAVAAILGVGCFVYMKKKSTEAENQD